MDNKATPQRAKSLDSRKRKKPKSSSPCKRRKIVLQPPPPSKNTKWDSFCWKCHKYVWRVVYCSKCERVYHTKCCGLAEKPQNDWICPECIAITKANEAISRSAHFKRLVDMNGLSSLLAFVLKRMRQNKGAGNFEYEINLENYPDYKGCIFRPMSLHLIECNIYNDKYKNCEEFLCDLKWIVHNSYIVNTAKSKVTMYARHMLRLAQNECDEIVSCSSCYREAYLDKNPESFILPCDPPHILVWAKLDGWPYWPAKIMKFTGGSFVEVKFFGQHQKAVVLDTSCYLYSKKPPVKQKKCAKFKKAIQECELHIERLKEKFMNFCFAGNKIPLDPKKENEQRKLLLPLFGTDLTSHEMRRTENSSLGSLRDGSCITTSSECQLSEMYNPMNTPKDNFLLCLNLVKKSEVVNGEFYPLKEGVKNSIENLDIKKPPLPPHRYDESSPKNTNLVNNNKKSLLIHSPECPENKTHDINYLTLHDEMNKVSNKNIPLKESCFTALAHSCCNGGSKQYEVGGYFPDTFSCNTGVKDDSIHGFRMKEQEAVASEPICEEVLKSAKPDVEIPKIFSKPYKCSIFQGNECIENDRVKSVKAFSRAAEVSTDVNNIHTNGTSNETFLKKIHSISTELPNDEELNSRAMNYINDRSLLSKPASQICNVQIQQSEVDADNNHVQLTNKAEIPVKNCDVNIRNLADDMSCIPSQIVEEEVNEATAKLSNLCIDKALVNTIKEVMSEMGGNIIRQMLCFHNDFVEELESSLAVKNLNIIEGSKLAPAMSEAKSNK